MVFLSDMADVVVVVGVETEVPNPHLDGIASWAS
jgi:hypothetical protein